MTLLIWVELFVIVVLLACIGLFWLSERRPAAGRHSAERRPTHPQWIDTTIAAPDELAPRPGLPLRPPYGDVGELTEPISAGER